MYTPEDFARKLEELLARTGRPDPIGFDRFRAPGPGAFYVTADDVLRIRSYFNSAPTGGVLVRGRILEPNGQIRPFEVLHPAGAAAFAQQTSTWPVGEGWLLSVAVDRGTTGTDMGSLFLEIGVARGGPGDRTTFYTLVSGYVTNARALSWPAPNTPDATEGPGLIVSTASADPGAGAELSFTVPGNTRAKLIACSFQLVTDATVANRFPALVIDDGANILYEAAAADAHVASTTIRYSGAAVPYNRVLNAANVVTIPLPPDLFLAEGYRVRTITSGLVAGDNYGAMQLLLRQWYEE